MSKKITSTGSTEVLYHYSCKERLFEILSSGYLKLTCSDIIMPDGTLEAELKAAAYHPVGMADRLFIRRKNGPGWVRL